MIAIGRLYIFKNRNIRKCNFCEGDILPEELYFRRIGSSNKHHFSSFLHYQCAFEKINSLVEAWKQTGYDKRTARPKGTRELPVTKDLTVEQIARRKALLMYLNVRDKESLIKAYEQHSTVRVFTVMNNIYKRLIELDAMGSKFPKFWDNEKFDNYFLKYDRDWWSTTAYLQGPELYNQFIRTLDTRYPPIWPQPTETTLNETTN